MNNNTLPKEVLEKCKEKFCSKYNVSNTYFENVWRSQWKCIKKEIHDVKSKKSIRINNFGTFLLKERRYKRYMYQRVNQIINYLDGR